MTETEYEKQQIESFEPKWDHDITGIHTFNHENNLTVIDGILRRRRSIFSSIFHR